MRWMLLTVLAMVLLRAGESIDTLQAGWQQAVDASAATYQQAVEAAGKAYAAAVGKARETCLAALVAAARREGRKEDRGQATALWCEVLRLRPDHPDANAYLDLLPKEQAERLRTELAAPAPAPGGDLLGEGPSTPAVANADTARLNEVETRERAAFAKAEAAARSRFTEAEGRVRAKALAGLGQLAERAQRGGDLPGAAAAWKAALVLQRDHAPAIAFFDKLGTTAEVLAALPAAADPLGPAPDPAGFLQGMTSVVPGPAGLRGAKILLVGEGEEHAPALQARITERLRQAGAQVTVQVHNPFGEYGGEKAGAIDAAVEASHLVLCFRVNDASRGGMVRLLRSARMGALCFDSNAFVAAGMAERIPYNGYLRGPVEPIEPIPGLRHPILTGLPASIAWLLPAKPAAKAPDPAAAAPIDQEAYFALNYPLCPGAVSLCSLPGKPDSRVVVAYDTGMQLQPRDDRGRAPEAPPPRPPGAEQRLPRTVARRVAFHLFNDPRVQSDPAVVARISPAAWKLFDASLVWARGR